METARNETGEAGKGFDRERLITSSHTYFILIKKPWSDVQKNDMLTLAFRKVALAIAWDMYLKEMGCVQTCREVMSAEVVRVGRRDRILRH